MSMFIASTAAIRNEGALRSLVEVVRHVLAVHPMIRRNTALLLLSLFVGPGIGGIAFLLLTIIVETAMGRATPFFGSFWPMALFGGYVLGAVPGLLSGIGMIILSNFVASRVLRLAASALVGALVSVLCITVMLTSGGAAPNVTILAVIALTGAISALSCMAIVEARHPLPIGGAA
jgi:hypothetical protein